MKLYILTVFLCVAAFTISATNAISCDTYADCRGEYPFCLNGKCSWTECDNDESCSEKYGNLRPVCNYGYCDPASE